ncbi:MAG: hypothetical protein SGJ15_05565 [Bacteroidota bacterium]|nr:hypothetical protein [Bacteroidota bacterium]
MKNFFNVHGKLVLTLLSFLAISLYYAIGNGVFPSIDGPSHWNNANLLKQYFLGNEVVKQNFELNTFYIPNIFSQYLLMFLMFFFKSTGAMIVFQIIHYMSFFMGFLYFLKAYQVKYAFFMSLIAVLFFNAFLLNIGFYNFSFSVIFLIIAIGYYQKHFSSNNSLHSSNYLILFVLLALLFYSNALTLLVFFLFVAFKELVKLYHHIKIKKASVKEFVLNEIKIVITFVPFLIMISLFRLNFPFQNPPMFSNDIGRYFSELISLSSFIVYHVSNEFEFVQWIEYSLLALFVWTLFWRIKKRKDGFNQSDVIFMLLLSVLALYLIIPDMYSVGMMSSRFLYFFFLFLILWLLLQNTKVIKLLMVLCIIVTVFFERDRRHIQILNQMNSKLKLVEQASLLIVPNSIVLPLDFSGNWLERHFAHYIGADKSLIILDNYEATVGWFPLKWRASTIPKYLLGESETVDGIYDCINKQGISKPIDYIFMYGDRRRISDNPQFVNILSKHYKKMITAENGMCSVYKLKASD